MRIVSSCRQAGDDISDIQEQGNDDEPSEASSESPVIDDDDGEAEIPEARVDNNSGQLEHTWFTQLQTEITAALCSNGTIGLARSVRDSSAEFRTAVGMEEDVELRESKFCWFGRPAVRIARTERRPRQRRGRLTHRESLECHLYCHARVRSSMSSFCTSGVARCTISYLYWSGLRCPDWLRPRGVEQGPSERVN